MRASLLHPISERRHARRSRGTHRAAPAPEPPAGAPEPPTAARVPHVAVEGPEIAVRGPDIAAECRGIAVHGPDIAAQRVRQAGGPTDLASYACQCGYLFTAAVSTTVGCPHCGTAQAW